LKQRLIDEQAMSRKLEEKIYEMKSASSEQDKVCEKQTRCFFSEFVNRHACYNEL